MKAENKEIVSGVGLTVVTTLFLGPLALLALPYIVKETAKDYKKAKEDRLVGEAEQALDQHVAEAEAEHQRKLRADEMAAAAKAREEQRAVERLQAEQFKLEVRREALRLEIVRRAQERERLTKIAQDWLDQYYAERRRRKVRAGILPTRNPLLASDLLPTRTIRLMKGESDGA
jgi:hypothetical protein